MSRRPRNAPPDETEATPPDDARHSAAPWPAWGARAEDEDDGPRRPSKSQLKREAHDVQALGTEIAALSVERLDALNLPEPLREAIDQLRRTRSHEGRRRQLQFVGKQMRAVDPEPLREQLATWKLGSAEETLRLHETERWRDELIADDGALTRWAETFPGSDLQHLRSLVRTARKQPAVGPEQRRGKVYRELFQFIKPWLSADDEADDETDGGADHASDTPEDDTP